MSRMNYDKAIEILHPETSKAAITEIEYYAGYNAKDAALEAITEATLLACDAMEKCKYRDENGWIYTYEDTPKFKVRVLVCYKLRDGKTYIDFGKYYDDETWSIINGPCFVDVVKWQPLPEI